MALQFSNLWSKLSTEALDRLVRSQRFRGWALARGEQQLRRKYVVENADRLPSRIQEIRCKALGNLLHAVDRALAEGRIAPEARRSIIKNFLGGLVIGETQRQRPFREEHGYDPPTFLTISPTKRCNLQCKGCYAASSAKNDNTLPYSVFSRILQDKKREWGSRFTVISGGEPLLYRSEGRDLFDVLAEHQDQYFMMYTNATLIDRAAARRLAELGNLTPAISVEGWEKQTDERRGAGVFRKIQRAMENLREAGVPFGVSVTATRNNAETVLADDFMDYYFRQQGAIYGWLFQYMPIGRSFAVELMVSPEQRKWMLEKELDLIFERDLFLIDFWNGGPMSLGCISAGRSGGYFYIDWNGNIAPCVFFPYYVENISELYRSGRSLNDVLELPYFRRIREWQAGYLRDGGKVGNLFRPCPMRDHHAFAHRTIREFAASPMDEEAERALADPEYRRRMEEYDAEVGGLLDPFWEKEIYPGALPQEAPRAVVGA
jgi:MoaA/NifB/PqqE/SkfB family radical SAM enzyme